MARAIPKQLREASDEFYMWVGMCIADWAKIDGLVFGICHKSLGCKAEKAAVVYFKSPALEVRITLTQELVESILPKTPNGKPIHPDLKAWNAIIKSLAELKSTRNRIAHHPVATRFAPRPDRDTPEGTAYEFWIENHLSHEEGLRGRSQDVKQPLKVEDLKDHHLATIKLNMALYDFLEHVLPTYS
jgi:hypothetical protein